MSSNEIAIQIENIGKRYQLGNVVDLSRTLRELIMDLPRQIGNCTGLRRPDEAENEPIRPGQLSSQNVDESQIEGRSLTGSPMFWALRDISFNVHQGDVVGVIGRNGAGKSTLLKILSRITTPTTGRVRLWGRVGALLEVGTGFSPELTGRENIYLNGTILGMRKAEVQSKFDEIVAFSGTEEFLETPVKRYSSGMRVRLAFAVAAYLEPEILIIDEVLAVGDSQFQKKCMGKLDEAAKAGRTIFFVSHNMAAVSGLCNRCAYLKHGQLVEYGPTDSVIQRYLADFDAGERISLAVRTDRSGNGSGRLTDIRFLDARTRQPLDALISGQDLLIQVSYETRKATLTQLDSLQVDLAFYTNLGQFVMALNSEQAQRAFEGPLERDGTVYCRIPRFPLMGGPYRITATLLINGALADNLDDVAMCNVEAGDYYGTGFSSADTRQGFYVDHSWHTDPAQD